MQNIIVIFLISFCQIVLADCTFDLGELPERFEFLRNSLVSTRSGLQGTLVESELHMVFTTADGHRGQMLASVEDGRS